MPRTRITKQEKERQRQQAIRQAQAEFFGGVTQEEARQVFKTLAVLAQFPGAEPPEPLEGCNVIWTSVMHVGDSKDKQVFDVEVNYKGLIFHYTKTGEKGIQLPDSTFMAFESWDYQALLIANKF